MWNTTCDLQVRNCHERMAKCNGVITLDRPTQTAEPNRFYLPFENNGYASGSGGYAWCSPSPQCRRSDGMGWPPRYFLLSPFHIRSRFFQFFELKKRS